MKRAPISACIIVRNDPHLEACVASFRDYVEEVCILVTAEKDAAAANVAAKYNCKIQYFTDCNEDDKIVDFSMARNKSFEMATQPWRMWIDSDDLMENAANLLELTKETVPVCYLFPYDYSFNEQGVVTCRHYRERLLNTSDCSFQGPVHEVLIPNITIDMVKSDSVVFKHQRQYITKPFEPSRNLRILKNFIEKNPDDARTHYYIGLEYANNGLMDDAKRCLSRYVDISGWDDERALACYKLVEIFGDDYSGAMHWAMKSLEIKPDWFESYYQVCKLFYFQKKWQPCVDFGRIALSKPPTETLLFINHNDRYDIHSYLNVALNNIGQIKEALDSCNAGLEGNPNDAHLLHNKKHYESFLNMPNQVELQPTNLACLDIVFAAGAGCETWSPENLKTTGIGGSETMLIHQARNLAALGHKVRVYATVDGTYDGVSYVHWSKYKDLACDVLVVSRNAQFLDDCHNVQAHLKLLWLHDVCAIAATSALLLKADRILCLSEWHKENVMNVHNLNADKIVVTRNGVDLERFMKPIKRNQYRCINSSSPDRSLPVLLECWKEIKRQVPEGELHIYYGFHNWKTVAAGDKLATESIELLERQIEETPGVVFHDRVSQDELAEAFQASQAWLYPTWFTETSCISAMEAITAGCHIVTSPIAALKETCAGYERTHFIEGVWTDKDYQERFIKQTVKILQNGE